MSIKKMSHPWYKPTPTSVVQRNTSNFGADAKPLLACLKVVTDAYDAFKDEVLTPYYTLTSGSGNRRELFQQIKFGLEGTRRKIVAMGSDLDMIQSGVSDASKEKAWRKACTIYPRATDRLEDLVILMRVFYQENVINHMSIEEFLNCVDHEHGVPDETVPGMKRPIEAMKWYIFSVVSDLVYLACRDHHTYYKIENAPPCFCHPEEGPPCSYPLFYDSLP